jgi:hypothetical protein
MKLIIARDQSKGLLGGNKFEFTARVQLTPEEAELVKKYKAGGEVLVVKEGAFGGQKPLTIGDLMEGQTFKCNNIAEILQYEASVKESCEAFKNYIEVMKGFGGEETIEFN